MMELTVAIMSNDTKNYPEDSFENMIKFAKKIILIQLII